MSGKFGTQMQDNKEPIAPIDTTGVQMQDGKQLDLSAYGKKKLLLVNTASDCGFTGQYEQLQELHQQFGDKVQLIGFPSNDFGEQEKGDDAEIAQFCQVNFGVTFPLAKKSTVKKSNDQNALYKWLSDASLNGWNDEAPSWNFCKYIIDEEGKLTHVFGPSFSPTSEEVLVALGLL